MDSHAVIEGLISSWFLHEGLGVAQRMASPADYMAGSVHRLR